MHSLRIFCACLLGVGASLLSTTGAVWASESVGYIPPGLYLRLSDAETGGTVQVQVRLAQVNHLIQTEGRKAILLAQKNNSWPDLDLKLKEFKFVEFSPGSPTISVVIELESKFGDCIPPMVRTLPVGGPHPRTAALEGSDQAVAAEVNTIY